jgi:transposase
MYETGAAGPSLPCYGERSLSFAAAEVLMISTQLSEPFSDLDQQVWTLVVPANHFLRLVAAHIDFEQFRPRLAEAYSPRMGRPAIDPVRMLKILFLAYHYRLSDRGAVERARTDMAFRWFLGLPLTNVLPHHTDGTYFRQRIGVERFTQIFQDLLSQARQAGLVRDRLRLKDATHLIANVADLRPLSLLAQMREHLCRAARPFFPDWAKAQVDRAEVVRQATAEAGDDERCAARTEHLRDMTTQLRERAAELPPADANDRGRDRLRRVLAVATQMVADHDDPDAGDAVFSSVDPDARVGKHGDYFIGYLLDLAVDADSELITAVNVLPGNGAEAADAVTLIQQEEAAQGNDVQATGRSCVS